jgi:gliding motility-associated-like protein
MFKRLRYIIVSAMLLFSVMQTAAQVAMPDNVCIGTTRLYSVNDPTVPSTYTWKIDGVTQTSTTNSISITWNTAGTFLVTVQEHAVNGCSGDIRSGYVYVNPLPNLVVNNPPAICSVTTVDLTQPGITTGSDPGLTLGYWTNAAGTNPLANPGAVAASGTYYISGTNSNGCKKIMPVVVTIFPALTATLTGGGPVCAGSGKTLTVTFTGIAPYHFTYTDGTNNFTVNGINSSTYQINVTPVVTTTYTITSFGDANCNGTVNNISAIVTVVPLLQPIRNPMVVANPNVPIQLSARNLGVGYSYLWNPSVGLSNSSIYNPMYNYNVQTDYRITITSALGCKVVDSLLVVLLDLAPPLLYEGIYVPKAWTPNYDGHNDKLFPMVANLRVIKYFRIFNRWGQLVFETNVLGQGWDGVFKGKPQGTDTYTWTAEAIGVNGRQYKSAGNSILIR